MIDESVLNSFHQQFDDLIAVATESNNRIIREDVDSLFADYLNVFIKSYVVSACSILEAFIQEMAFRYMAIIQERVSQSNIPHNLVLWCALSEKQKDFAYKPFLINTTRKEISEIISGNFYKTVKAFEKVGVNLEGDEEFRSFKDTISSTIDKRNMIVHHNDDASDISLTDVVRTIVIFKSYSKVIHRIVSSSPHLVGSA